MPHLLIIGGSDAGTSAALRAKEVSPSWEVTIVLRDRFLNYSICGLPFYISGEVADWRDLAHRTVRDIEGRGVRVLMEHTALSIDAGRHSVLLRDLSG
ncbi:MAG: CoA-disulfide reductase, partial [Chloroflexi bacterium]|nr:CoA-disulfide reductase [Chloroflexota bacterium]